MSHSHIQGPHTFIDALIVTHNSRRYIWRCVRSLPWRSSVEGTRTVSRLLCPGGTTRRGLAEMGWS